jgi:hypothetical protein
MIRWWRTLLRRVTGRRGSASDPAPGPVPPHASPTDRQSSPTTSTPPRRAPVQPAAPRAEQLGEPVRKSTSSRPRSGAEAPTPPPVTVPARPAPFPTRHGKAMPLELLLDDFSGESYGEVAHGFAPPPVASQRSSGKAQVAYSLTHVSPVLPPVLAEELVDELVELEQRLEERLQAEPIALHLPRPAPGRAGHYQLPMLEPRFLVREDDGSARPRTLELTLSDGSSDPSAHPDDLDRLELARLVTILVEELHLADTMTAGLGLDRIAVDLSQGRPAVALVDTDGLRRLGSEFPGGDPGGRSIDTDRRELASVVVALLADGDDCMPDEVAGLDGVQVSRLGLLVERAEGPAGTMPRAAEWLEALS